MASSGKRSAGKTNLLGKRAPKDDLDTKPILKKHKENSEEKETVEGLDDTPKFIEETTKGFADSLEQIEGTVELLETKSDQANLIPVKETVEGLDYVESVAARKKTLVLSHLSRQTNISDIISFFKDVGRVVRVRLFVNFEGYITTFGSVEFASANEAKKAHEKKIGEYLCGNKRSITELGCSKIYCLLLPLLLSLLIWIPSISLAATNPDDVAAINGLFAALGAPVLPGWIASGGDPCGEAWQGIICNVSDIISITVNAANLQGELGDNLAKFTSIRGIDFSNNSIGGSIPSNLPVTLQHFFHSANQFTGSIPESLRTIEFSE